MTAVARSAERARGGAGRAALVPAATRVVRALSVEVWVPGGAMVNTHVPEGLLWVLRSCGGQAERRVNEWRALLRRRSCGSEGRAGLQDACCSHPLTHAHIPSGCGAARLTHSHPSASSRYTSKSLQHTRNKK